MTATREPDEAAVAAFLRAHPDWLAENAHLYRMLAPPVRVHGEALADHMAAMLQAERTRTAQLARQTEELLDHSRSAAGLAERVQAAVLALIRAPNAGEWVTDELPGLLGLDSACLRRESRRAGDLPPGTVARLLGGRDAMVREGLEADGDAVKLHGEAALLARVDALVRVKLPTPTMLVLACREPGTLSPGKGCAALAFLGAALAARLAV